MLNAEAREKLQDADYLGLHLRAVSAIARVGKLPWYDSHFIRRLEAAKIYLADVSPEKLDPFLGGFAPLEPRDDFAVVDFSDVFCEETHQQIVDVTRSMPVEALSQHEAESFGRNIVHDHPFFTELQQRILPRMTDALGQELESGYNFLSLYGEGGNCDLHTDEPFSMYTLDYCIEQSAEWPIYISKPFPRPAMHAILSWSPDAMKEAEEMDFRPHVLQPNDAILFNGSSQWHYRDVIPDGNFCNLLFFHFYPAGLRDLVLPSRWPEYFGMDELRPLCDLFTRPGVDGLD